MIAMTRCGRMRRRLEAFLDGELPPAEARRVEAHLDDCAHCREALVSLRRRDALVRDAAAAEDATGSEYWETFMPRLRARLAQEEEAGHPFTVPGRLPGRGPLVTPFWSAVIGSAAVAVLAFLVFYANENSLAPHAPLAPPPGPAPSPVVTVGETESGAATGAANGAAPETVQPAANAGAPAGGAGAPADKMTAPSAAVRGRAAAGERVARETARSDLQAGGADMAAAPGGAGTVPAEGTGAGAASPPSSAPGASVPMTELRPGGLARGFAPASDAVPGVERTGSPVRSLALRQQAAPVVTDSTGAAKAAPPPPPPPDLIARDVLARIARIEADARAAEKAPDYSDVRPLLESLEPAALHPRDSGLPDSLAAEVLSALERVRR